LDIELLTIEPLTIEHHPSPTPPRHGWILAPFAEDGAKAWSVCCPGEPQTIPVPPSWAAALGAVAKSYLIRW